MENSNNKHIYIPCISLLNVRHCFNDSVLNKLLIYILYVCIIYKLIKANNLSQRYIQTFNNYV